MLRLHKKNINVFQDIGRYAYDLHIQINTIHLYKKKGDSYPQEKALAYFQYIGSIGERTRFNESIEEIRREREI